MKKFLTSNKSFGFLLFFILNFFHFIFFKFNYSIILPISAIVIILSLTMPNIFSYPKKLWIKFGVFLGKLLNPIICIFLYFFVVGLTKIALDIFNKKLIQKKSNSDIKTNWRKRNDNSYINFDNQF
tara:strand:+ start:308 stop:685 length:378 start_codon:yes stop_codon:yes gene_type:complete